MKIEGLTAELYRIPPSTHWEDATHRVPALEFVVAQVHTDAGVVGTGFTYSVGVGGSAIVSLLLDYCAGMLVGQDPLRIAQVWDMLHDQLHRCGTGGINTLALAAVDLALWDIAGKHYDTSVYRLLGGTRDSVPAYGSGINLHLDESALLSQVEGLLNRGFSTFKIKIGRDDPYEDLARIEAVQRLIGSKHHLIVDANQKWNFAEALPRAQLLRDHGLLFLEEPLHAEDISGHAGLRQLTGMAIAAGESLYTNHQFLEYLRADAVDIVQADICRVGGLTPFVQIAQLAHAFHRKVAPHFLAEISVTGLCGIPNGLILEWVLGGSLSEMGVLEEPLRLENGVAYPFDRPGHGIRFDFARLAPYRSDAEQLRKLDLRSAK